MVVTPHARLAVRHFMSWRNVIPPIGPMIYAVQQNSLVIRGCGEIGFLEQSLRHGEPSIKVSPALLTEIAAQANKALGADCARRRIHRLKVIERIGRK